MRPGERGEARALMNCEGLAVARGEELTLSRSEFECVVMILGGMDPFLADFCEVGSVREPQRAEERVMWWAE